MNQCFFIGHRDAPNSLLPILIEAVERHIILYGVTEFIVGHYGRFDRLAAQAVLSAKAHRPSGAITLTLLLPYHPFHQPIPLPSGFDQTFYPPGLETAPYKAAILRANRYMVNHCSHLIAYVWHPASNARDLLQYAQTRAQKGILRVENLAMPNLE